MADVQIPKKHKAAVYDKPGSISTKIEELDVPEPGPGEVLINLYVLVSIDQYLVIKSIAVRLANFPAGLILESVIQTWA